MPGALPSLPSSLFQAVQDRREIEALFEEAQDPRDEPTGLKGRLRQLAAEDEFEDVIVQTEE